MSDPLCHHKDDYNGPERRIVPDRREECLLHSGLQKSYDDLKELQESACRAIGRVEKAMEGKVPMKLFYVMIGLIITILAFQWTTYERVNATALLNQKATGEIKLQVQSVKSSVEQHQLVNKVELNEIRNSIQNHQKQTDHEVEIIYKGIERLNRKIDNGG